MARGNLFVISGPAGAGKTEIVKRLLSLHPEIGISVSCTTRAPRQGEVDGKSYFFISDEVFDRMIRDGGFYEWAHVHQNRYGTPRAYVEEELAKGRDMILEIDVQGCLQAMEQDPSVTGIFVSPPSRENLESRLRGRGTESEESIRVRLGNVAKEVEQAYRYDYVIIHQDWNDVPNALDIAVEEVFAIIRVRKLAEPNRREFLDQLTQSLKKED